MMRLVIPLVLAVVGAAPLWCDTVNADSVIIQDFEKRVGDYVQIRKSEESKLPKLKSTKSQEKITHYQAELEKAIAAARKTARQGDIFTPAVDKEFRRLIGLAMQPADAGRIRKSMQHAEPVTGQPQVNHAYLAKAPLQSTPPSLLMNLPKLPADIEYRFVNRTLVLLDSKANLVIDLMTNVGPQP